MKTIIEDSKVIQIEDVNFDVFGRGAQPVRQFERELSTLRGDIITLRNNKALSPAALSKLKQASELTGVAFREFRVAIGIEAAHKVAIARTERNKPNLARSGASLA